MNQEPTTKELLTAIQANQVAIQATQSVIQETQKTTDDILEAIHVFATDTHERFEKVEWRLDNIETKVGNIETRVGNIETRVGNIESTMVTQSVFQRALDSLEDRLTNEITGQNRKLVAVVRLLEQKHIFSAQEVKELFA